MMIWQRRKSVWLALQKTVLFGLGKGKRRRGRQKKRWQDNIKEWTGIDFASSTRTAENMTKLRGIVAKSSLKEITSQTD